MRDRVDKLDYILLGGHRSFHVSHPLLKRTEPAVALRGELEQFIESILKLGIIHTASFS